MADDEGTGQYAARIVMRLLLALFGVLLSACAVTVPTPTPSTCPAFDLHPSVLGDPDVEIAIDDRFDTILVATILRASGDARGYEVEVDHVLRGAVVDGSQLIRLPEPEVASLPPRTPLLVIGTRGGAREVDSDGCGIVPLGDDAVDRLRGLESL
jgi:hypothetical protein